MVSAIYNYFYKKEDDSLKAMGLCYYSYVWLLVFEGREIAPFRFRKSPFGPVDFKALVETKETPCMTDYLDFTYETYLGYTGEKLIEKIMNEPLYKTAFSDITKDHILDFFNGLI